MRQDRSCSVKILTLDGNISTFIYELKQKRQNDIKISHNMNYLFRIMINITSDKSDYLDV